MVKAVDYRPKSRAKVKKETTEFETTCKWWL